MNIETPALLILLGQVLIGSLFVFGGLRHFFLVPVIAEVLSTKGIPFPKASLMVVSSYQVIAGVLVMLDRLMPWTAYSLILFTIIASIIMLNFWHMEGLERNTAINNWLTNIAIIGGLLIIAA